MPVWRLTIIRRPNYIFLKHSRGLGLHDRKRQRDWSYFLGISINSEGKRTYAYYSQVMVVGVMV